MLLIHPKWNAGFVYHTPFFSDYRVSATVRSTLGPTRSLDVRGARLHLPGSFGAGVSRRLGSRWTAAASVTRDPWSGALVHGLPGSDRPVNLFDGLPRELTTTRDTTQLNLGLEHLILHEGSVVPLRLGVGWEPQGAMDPVTRDPVTFHLVAAGAGYNTNRFKLDAAVQYRWGGIRLSETLTVDGALRGGPVDAIGNADAHEWRIKVSLIYRMPDADSLRDLVRRIF
jgi:hypothetical protein